MKKSRIIQSAAGIILAAIGLYIFYRQSFSGDDAVWDSLTREIANTNITAVIICIILTIFPMWLRAWRLQIMLPDSADFHKRGFFSIMTISFMANNILPARLGEAARVVLMWKRNKIPVAAGVGALLVERALDIMAYLSFLFVPVMASPQLRASLRDVGGAAFMTFIYLSAAIFAFFAAVVFLYAAAPRIFKSCALAVIQKTPEKYHARLRKIASELNLNAAWLKSPRKIFYVISLSYTTAFCFALMLLVLVNNIGVFALFESLFAQAFAAFGSAIPLAPGGVGTLHAALQFGLTTLGIEPIKANAVTVIYHALQYVVVTSAGLLLLLGLHIKFSDIIESDKA